VDAHTARQRRHRQAEQPHEPETHTVTVSTTTNTRRVTARRVGRNVRNSEASRDVIGTTERPARLITVTMRDERNAA
jgi:hypothetical protein